MSHDYYCTHCGAKINSGTVLFDMQALLTGAPDKRLEILRFRLTEEDLRQLLANGSHCSLTLGQVMGFIGNPNNNRNNLGDPAIAGLTMEEIDAFLDYEAKWHFVDDDADDDLFSIFSDFSEPEPKPSLPEGIRRLLPKDHIALPAYELARELEMLKEIFDGGKALEFDLQLTTEPDDQGGSVVTGMCLELNGQKLVLENRLCPECGEAVLPHAGTARHHCVTFLGEMASGKTSVQLALTHYALNRLLTDVGSPIWENTPGISGVKRIELLNPSEYLREDLQRYSKGVALDKTYPHSDSIHNPTFLIEAADGHRSILTLTEIPGELCRTNGSLDQEKIFNELPLALACDAVVLCVDPNRTASQEEQKNSVLLLRNLAEDFQRVRAIFSGSRIADWVPTMVLFTKYPEPELWPSVWAKAPRTPAEAAYLQWQEQAELEQSPLFVPLHYEFIQQNMGYYAMLGCTAYGYTPVPFLHPENIGSGVPLQPKNIHTLMHWLLCVTGCIPVELNAPESKAERHTISRPQLRAENPLTAEEAQARCRLFANPGRFDRLFLEAQLQKGVALLMRRLDSHSHPNANAD